MKLAIVANVEQKKELLSRPTVEGVEIVWLQKPQLVADANGYFDLLWEDDFMQEEKGKLHEAKESQPNAPLRLLIEQQQTGSLLIVSSVLQNSAALPDNCIRINGWNSFLDKALLEVAGGTLSQRKTMETICEALNRKTEWVKDQVGFIAPRVIASIINEAYYALQEGVSDKSQIDTAMKLGTNYPLGPFAWADKIGLQKIYRLLNVLSTEDARYLPAPLLTEEANH